MVSTTWFTHDNDDINIVLYHKLSNCLVVISEQNVFYILVSNLVSLFTKGSVLLEVHLFLGDLLTSVSDRRYSRKARSDWSLSLFTATGLVVGRVMWATALVVRLQQGT